MIRTWIVLFLWVSVGCGDDLQTETPSLASAFAPYRGMALVKLQITTTRQEELLDDLEARQVYETRGAERFFLVDNDKLPLLDGMLVEVVRYDFSDILPPAGSQFITASDPHTAWYSAYRTASQVNDRVEQIGTRSIAKSFEVGRSVEDRPILGLKLASGANKPGVFLLGGQHANEWGGHAISLYVVDRLSALYGTDAEVKRLLDAVQIVAVPLANPDGYTWAQKQDRQWRKSRRPPNNAGTTNAKCWGADLNRNWEVTGWSPKGDCTSGYTGPSLFSEPETSSVRDLVEQVSQPDRFAFIDYHCCGKEVVYPYSYTSKAVASEATYQQVGSLMRDAISSSYALASGRSLNHTGVGTSKDWAHDALGLWSFTIELPSASDYDASKIIATAEQHLAGVLALMDWLASRADGLVVDNLDQGATSKGDWPASGGTSPFGADSVYSKTAGDTFTFSTSLTGTHDVSMWWSGWSTRCASVRVDVLDGAKLKQTVHVDQSSDAGQWNDIAEVAFSGQAKVVIHATGADCSTCADGVRFVPKTPTEAQDAGPSVDSSTPTSDASLPTDSGDIDSGSDPADAGFTETSIPPDGGPSWPLPDPGTNRNRAAGPVAVGGCSTAGHPSLFGVLLLLLLALLWRSNRSFLRHEGDVRISSGQERHDRTMAQDRLCAVRAELRYRGAGRGQSDRPRQG